MKYKNLDRCALNALRLLRVRFCKKCGHKTLQEMEPEVLPYGDALFNLDALDDEGLSSKWLCLTCGTVWLCSIKTERRCKEAKNVETT